MKTKQLFRHIVVLLLLMVFSCAKKDSVMQQQEQGLISLSPHYTLDDKDEAELKLNFSLSLSDVTDPQALSVEVRPDLVVLLQKLKEIENSVALPADLYPAFTVEVPEGQQEAKFTVSINRARLVEKYGGKRLYGKQLVAALTLAKPSRYAVNGEQSTVVVVINSADYMPEPQEPEEPEEPVNNSILKNGNFSAGNANWTVTDQSGTINPQLAITFDNKLTFSGSATGSGSYNKVVYQAVTVQSGKKYKFSGDIAVSGTRANPGWIEFFLHGNQPAAGGDYNTGKLIGFQHSDLGTPASGKIEVLGKQRDDSGITTEGVFTAKVSGTVYFVIKVGSGWGGNIGMVELDNLILEELHPGAPSNLIQNGDFSAGNANWTFTRIFQSNSKEKSISDYKIEGGVVKYSNPTADGGNSPYISNALYQAVQVEQGKKYQVSIDLNVTEVAGYSWIRLQLGNTVPPASTGAYSGYIFLEMISAANQSACFMPDQMPLKADFAKVACLTANSAGKATSGVYTAATTGTVYFALVIGADNGRVTATVDNIKMIEVN